MSRAVCAIVFVLCVFCASVTHAQLSGSLTAGMQSSSNIQNLDTTAPDNIFLPAVQLSYAWQPAAVSTITLGGAFNPALYSTNSDLSYGAFSLAVTGAFYLTNQAAIKAESAEGKVMHATILPIRGGTQAATPSPPPLPQQAASPDKSGSHQDNSTNESLVETAVSELYTLSGALDSTEINGKGLTKNKVAAWESTRDSVSEVVTTFADLLDSIGYSESAAQVLLPELEALRAPLNRVLQQSSKTTAQRDMLTFAVEALRKTKPESDFLASPQTPLPSAVEATAAGDNEETEAVASAAAQSESSAPIITLLNSSTRLREFGATDASIVEDISDSSATTLASLLTIPITYSTHTGKEVVTTGLFGRQTTSGNPNDDRLFSIGAGYELYPTRSVSMRLSYDFANSKYPNDSAYTNTENRIRLGSRIGLGEAVMLFGEFSVGLRKYTDPLQFANLKTQPPSDFTQYTYGAGIATFLSDRLLIGALASFNKNPNLRAYVTDASLKLKRNAVQIADDEFTYDLSRFALFSTSRIFADIDLTLDLSRENRTYGAFAKKIAGKLGQSSGAGRTDTGTLGDVTITKMFVFEDRLLSAFQSFTLEAGVNIASVTSSDPNFSYKNTGFSFSASLGF